MSRPSHDPNVFEEPHVRGDGAEAFEVDPGERRAERALESRRPTDDERIDQSAWDEPGIDGGLAERPEDAPTYAQHIEEKRRRTSAEKSWLYTLFLAAVAGPWAVMGAFYGGQKGALAIVVIGPVVEEVMKVAAALYAVERRPWMFRSRAQIAVCALAAGFAFAVIENLLYLNVYIKDPTPAIIFWRWTVCVGLHMGCALVGGLGLMRIWKDVWDRRARPRLSLATPYLIAAVAIHGTYNALALVMQFTVFRF